MLWHRGHACKGMAGAVLCVLRARFFRLEVRRFGTAIGVVNKRCELSRNRGLAGARPSVEIGPTGRTQPAALVATLDERRGGYQPLLANRRPQIEAVGSRVKQKHIGVIEVVRAPSRQRSAA